MSIDRRHKARSYKLMFQHTSKKYFDFKVNLLKLEGRVIKVKTGYGSLAYRFISRALTSSNFPIKTFYYTGHHNRRSARKNLTYRNLYKYINLNALALWIADDGSLRYNNNNKNTPILSLHVQNSNKDQVAKYVRLFKSKYNCKARVYKDKRVKTFGNFLSFDTKDTLYLLNQLRKKHIKGMEYKFYFTTDAYLGGLL